MILTNYNTKSGLSEIKISKKLFKSNKFTDSTDRKASENHNPDLSKTLLYQYRRSNHFLVDKNSSSYNNFVLLQRKTKAYWNQ